MTTTVHVISTGWAHPTRHICEQSVRTQVDVVAVHTYIEASLQDPPRTKLENLVDTIRPLPDDTIVALVDGDDWLAHKRALARIAQAHNEGAWVTYGSFRNSDGTRGFADPYGPDEDWRTTNWRATHLKTFRAGLFNRIKPADLQYKGKWIDRADDPSFMFPVLEMAGKDRVQWIRDLLYVYNEAAGWHRTASPQDLEHQRAIHMQVMARPHYRRLDDWSSPVQYDEAHATPAAVDYMR